jgi:hypothetical protein
MHGQQNIWPQEVTTGSRRLSRQIGHFHFSSSDSKDGPPPNVIPMTALNHLKSHPTIADFWLVSFSSSAVDNRTLE